jgi:3-hydroxybutyryl-CoA dehydrogenase
MKPDEVRRITVVGAGTMGHGIAQVAALAGYEIVLRDVDAETTQESLERCRASLDRAVARGHITVDARDDALGRIVAEADFSQAVAEAHLVIEAVPEVIDLKLVTFRALDHEAPEDAVLATCTSALPVTEIASAVERPERVVGMHFFNPVPAMKLLELVRADQTAPEALAVARAVAIRMGKEVIEVVDSPGFATSRMGIVIALEAMRMLEQGVASAEDIDRAMELGYGHPMGPLRLTDLVGLDIRLGVADHLHAEIGEAFRPPALLRRLVRAGKLGRKTGEGFYRYD